MYQVKWFNKKKGYGFATGADNTEYFCHHTDIRVEGYKYLKRGEYVSGEVVSMGEGKSKLANIDAPTEWGQLMCEVERTS
jgi:CspA family cold shock protein